MTHLLSPLSHFFARLRKDDKGTQLVETAVWLGLITAAVVATVSLIGEDVGTIMENISNHLDTAAANGGSSGTGN